METHGYDLDVYQQLGGMRNQRIPNTWTRGAFGGGIFLCMFAFTIAWCSTVSSSATESLPAEVLTEDVGPNVDGTFKLWVPRMLPVYQNEPLAKNIIRRFDLYLMNGATFDTGEFKVRNVGQWLAPEFIYDTVGFPNSKTLEGWCLSGEESQYRTAFPTTSFSQMLFFGDDTHSTTTSYGNGHWEGDLFGIPAPKVWTYFRVTDFYHIRKTGPNEGLVHYNFMMIDFADLFRRVGRPVLPPATLPEGLVLTASANDGVPAPLSVLARSRDNVSAKAAVTGALLQGWAGEASPEQWWHSDLTFYGPGGIGVARSADEYHQHVIQPFRAAFANRTLDAHMLFCEGNYCGAFGYLKGMHVGMWVGQAASYEWVDIRFAMHFRVVDKKIKEGWAIFDMPGFLKQLGKDLFAIARDNTPHIS